MNGGGSDRTIGDGSDNLLENPGEGFFTLLDYGLFLSMLAVSGFIGLYYGFFSKRKQDNPTEYILGNQEMTVLPVAASMIVSHIAGVTMLALPADVYANGTQYVMSFISIFIVGASLVYIYIPVFYDLGFTSCFTYLEKRFDKRVKLTASLVYTLDCILSTPIVIYVPALAFNQVSGINVHYITVATCALCIFYTTIGGLRAVVWTDTIQFGSIIGAVVAVMCIGTISQGGIWNVFEAAERGGRLIFFNLDPNPVVKSTFWSVTMGLTMMWISQKSASQSTIQRCLSLPDQKKAKRCVWIFSAGVSLIKIASCYVGILLYAKYEDCDPYSSGITKKLDQILPYYAMSIAKLLPGLTGLFIAGIFAAALSTMSSTLNSLAGTIFEDLIKPLSGKLGAKATSNIMKITVVCIGAIVVALVFVVEQLGAILHLAYSLHGLTAGALVGIFTMGMLSPHINTKGIISGAVASLLCVGTIMVGAQFSPKPPTLPFRTDGCTFPVTRNSTAIWIQSKEAFDEVPWIFRISFMYYALIGAITVAIVSYPVSLATGGCKEEVDEHLLATFIRRKVKDNLKYKTVELTPVNNE